MNAKRPCLFRTRLLTPSLLSAVLLLVSLNRASAAQNLPCGITHGTISSLRQTNLYSLAGVAGDVLRITSAGTAGGVCPEIEIVDVGNIGCGDSYSTLMLPTNGIYNVRVYDSGNSHTGGYDLSVTYATEKCTAIPLHCGVITNTFTNSIQQHTYTFSGNEGDVIRLTSASLTGDVCPDMEVFQSGTYLASFGCYDSFSTLTLPATGTYVVLARERSLDRAGSYALGLAFATSKCAIEIGCGTITNEFTSFVQQHAYTIRGNEGDVIRLTSASLTGDVCPDMDVFQSGKYLASFGCYDSFSTLTLPTTGTYVVLARERSLDRTGSYALGLASSSSKCGSTLNCGKTIIDSFTNGVQQNTYSFYGYSREMVRFTTVGISENVCADVDVFGPSGSLIGSFGCYDYSGTLTLPTNGTYTAIARERDVSTTGSYALTFESLTGCFQLLAGSAVVQTQTVFCLPLQALSSTPAAALKFRIEAPCGSLSNATLSTGTRFTSATVRAGTNCDWWVSLQASSDNPVRAAELIGAICFTGVSTQSAFVPIVLTDVVITNVDGSVLDGIGARNRLVLIADQPLLEAARDANGTRLLTLFGKANKNYAIETESALTQPGQWVSGWTNSVPASLFYSAPLPADFKDAATLFLRAKEL